MPPHHALTLTSSLMREAVEAHVDMLRSEGLTLPPPNSFPGYAAA